MVRRFIVIRSPNFDDFVGSVLLFTGICLAMAGHFQSVLAASDLSAYDLRFVSVAILKMS